MLTFVAEPDLSPKVLDHTYLPVAVSLSFLVAGDRPPVEAGLLVVIRGAEERGRGEGANVWVGGDRGAAAPSLEGASWRVVPGTAGEVDDDYSKVDV